MLPALNRKANKSFAVLVLTVALWVTEALPYFVTALLVPCLVVMLDVLCVRGGGCSTE